MRVPLVAGNWKMNLLLAEARALLGVLRDEVDRLPRGRVEVAVCPAAPYLFPVAKALDGSSISFGAQNLYHEPAGAFTGEVSAAMIRDCGARWVILGHSERRHTIGHLEDDRMINLKLRAARGAGLTPILCVGETLAERERGATDDVLTFQLRAALVNAPIQSGQDLVIAYEPVWAIGTGRNATPDQAQTAHAHLRAELRRTLAGAGDPTAAGAIASTVRILYGGSVKPDNAAEIFSQPDVDGGLIGGASLKGASFVGIVRAALAAAG